MSEVLAGLLVGQDNAGVTGNQSDWTFIEECDNVILMGGGTGHNHLQVSCHRNNVEVTPVLRDRVKVVGHVVTAIKMQLREKRHESLGMAETQTYGLFHLMFYGFVGCGDKVEQQSRCNL